MEIKVKAVRVLLTENDSSAINSNIIMKQKLTIH